MLALTNRALMLLRRGLSTLQRKREREDELLFVGQQYRSAILRHDDADPAGQPRLLPRTLRDGRTCCGRVKRRHPADPGKKRTAPAGRVGEGNPRSTA